MTEINQLLEHLRKLESEHLRLVCELAQTNKAIAAGMLNVSFDTLESLRNIPFDELDKCLINVFQVNRKSILTINSPLNFTNNDTSYSASDCIALTRVKASERKILMQMREIVREETAVGMISCNIDYNDAITLGNTPLDVVEDCVYANRNCGLLKLAIDDMKGLKEFMKVRRLSFAGIQFDRLLGY